MTGDLIDEKGETEEHFSSIECPSARRSAFGSPQDQYLHPHERTSVCRRALWPEFFFGVLARESCPPLQKYKLSIESKIADQSHCYSSSKPRTERNRNEVRGLRLGNGTNHSLVCEHERLCCDENFATRLPLADLIFGIREGESRPSTAST